MKPGFLTSEFALTAVAFLAGILNKKLGLDIDPQVLLGLLGAVVTYVMQRGWVKAKASAPEGLPPFTMTPETAAKLGLAPKP